MVLFSRYWKIILFFVILSLVPAIITIGDIYHGRIAFWFDPARDFLLALQNHSNPTLIGQPSGIPGVFYGPYWIWLISLALLASKDPAFVSLLILSLPYFTIFPLFLYQLTKKWGLTVFFSLWVMFAANFRGYFSQLWNVNLFPLFILISIFFSVRAYSLKRFRAISFLFSGIFTGLSSSFHLSLGIPVVLGITIFHFIFLLTERKFSMQSLRVMLSSLFLYAIGLIMSYVPFILFELRHSFHQTKTFFNAVANTLLYDSSVVGQTSFGDEEIVRFFFARFQNFLSIPFDYIVILVLLLVFGIILNRFLKSIVIEKQDIRTLSLSIICLLVTIYLYLHTENPVWDYYFLGLEIFFMLIFGFLISKTIYGKWLIIIFAAISLFGLRDSLFNSFKNNDYTVSDLGTKKYIVNTIVKDSNSDYSYYAYSPSIYSHEYDYLFKWLDEDRLKENASTTYLIIPKVNESIKQDFINYRAPGEKYKETRKWQVPDGSVIYRMERL